MSVRKIFTVLASAIITLLIFNSAIFAQNDEDKLNDLNNKIEEYTAQIDRLQSEGATLANQVAQFNAQINLTTVKIDQTQEQIVLLGGRIDQLEGSLDNLTDAFNSRVEATYKMARVDSNPVLLLASDNVSEAVSTYHYLQKIQEADNLLIGRLESAKNTYAEQKTELESLEQVLGAQKTELNGQKAAKANLLALTRNDEARYQSLLEQAREEYKAIQAIIAGAGDETKIGEVNTGDRIASVIQGASCNSSGAHLHFIVTEGDDVRNPFNYLKPGIGHKNCSGPGSCSDGDSFNPSGSWNWPMSPTIHYTQGYGSTWAVRNTWVGRIYSFHNGIDIDSDSNNNVRAVQPGTLYRGSFSGSGGCRLRYVRVDHKNSNIDTWYLHINY